jgi:hypothetical protein
MEDVDIAACMVVFHWRIPLKKFLALTASQVCKRGDSARLAKTEFCTGVFLAAAEAVVADQNPVEDEANPEKCTTSCLCFFLSL